MKTLSGKTVTIDVEPEDSIAAKEPSEMLRRWAASPFNPKSNPTYLNQPEEG